MIKRGLIYHILAVMALLLVAACSQSGSTYRASQTAGKQSFSSASSGQKKGQGSQQANLSSTGSGAVFIKVDNNPDQFLGANLSIINDKIGAPIFARRDGAVEVWQYRRLWENGTCHLDLFLYPDDQSDLVVKYVDLRSQFLSREDQTACFAEMLRDHIREQG